MPNPDRKLLVLDLDETLIYATMFELEQHPDFRIGMAQVVKRPGVDRFLASCLESFNVGIWTSATREYAEDVLGHLLNDTSKLAFVRTREHCTKKIDPHTHDRCWSKDMGKLLSEGHNAKSIIVVDDSSSSWSPYEANVVPVSKFKGDPTDRELDSLLPFLPKLSRCTDVRSVDKHEWKRHVK